MGGTNLFDQRLSYYRLNIKSNRWPHRIYFPFFKSSFVNAIILHQQVSEHKNHYNLSKQLNFELNYIAGVVKIGDKSFLSANSLLTEDVVPNHIPRSNTGAHS